MLEKNPIFQSVSRWVNRTFSNPEALGLFFFLLIIFLLIEFCAALLMPVFIAVVLAYLLIPLVNFFKRCRFPRLLAVIVTFLIFLGLLVWFLFGLLPVLAKQMGSLAREIPQSFEQGQHYLNHWLAQYPTLKKADPLGAAGEFLKNHSASIGQWALSYSLATLPGLFEAAVYFVLVPILVFFFLKDSQSIVDASSEYLPQNRGLIYKVLGEMKIKIGGFLKGHFIEMVVVALVSAIVFSLFGLHYSALLGFAVGLSTWIPYVGAVIVTIPVCIIALMQWGISPHFLYLLVVYGAIIALDGNLLGPMLMSEAVDLHPIVVILAVIVFGGIWGFWGVFFAVPLATLVKVILLCWPTATAQSADN